MSKRRLLCLVSSLVLMVPGTAHSAPADASTPPRTSGPVVGAAIPCEDNGPAGPQESKAQTCSWSYQLLPVETSPTQDYQVYWVQMEIDPGKGWCAREIYLTIRDETSTIISAVPARDRRIARYTEEVTRLTVDGGGAAPVAGQIEQDVALGKGKISVHADPDGYSFRWQGNSKKKVMFAVGLQKSRDAAPLDLFSTWEESSGGGMGSCRPLILRIRG